MLTAEQKEQIAGYVKDFKERVFEYLQTREKLNECQETIRMKNDELSKVAKEERQIETAVDVLYRQTKKISRAKDLETEISNAMVVSRKRLDDLNQLETKLLELLRNLPIPVDLERPEQHDLEICFPYFEGMELGEATTNALCELVRQKPPLAFGDVTILPDMVTVGNISNKQEAIQKLVKAIETFRIRVDILSESYEKVDVLIGRLASSKLYPLILKTLAEKERLSAQGIAETLNIDERTAYDNCYNLTRSNWNPSPVQKLPSGQWELTLAGRILVDRLFEKYPQMKTQIMHKESVK